MPTTRSTLAARRTHDTTSLPSTPGRHSATDARDTPGRHSMTGAPDTPGMDSRTSTPDAPGICGSFWFRPKLARPLAELVEVLLRGPSTLTAAERALIAAYIAGLNDCRYCYQAHSAYAAARLPGGMALVEQVRADPESAPIPAKLKALLVIASAVRQGGAGATDQDLATALAAGATEAEIHDCVLIAAALWHVRPAPRPACRRRS
jgi:AhpD family alkylhydroperoxidase